MLGALFGTFSENKCKTLVRLCVGRIKLLQNKRALQTRNMRKDIAGLIASGKGNSASIRVEGLIQEESMAVAFEVLELYCELLVVRVQLISHSKSIPEDMQEALASIVYAAQRCSSQLPELAKVRDQLGHKYGRDWIQRAQNDATCVQEKVSPRLVDSLAIRAPPAERKMELLADIAQEFNVDWDPSEYVATGPRPDPESQPDPQAVPSPTLQDAPFYPEVTHNPSRDAAIDAAVAEMEKNLDRGNDGGDVMPSFVSAEEAAAAAMRAAKQATEAADAAARYAGQKKGGRKGTDSGSDSDEGQVVEEPSAPPPLASQSSDSTIAYGDPSDGNAAVDEGTPSDQSPGPRGHEGKVKDKKGSSSGELDELSLRFEALKANNLPQPPKHL